MKKLLGSVLALALVASVSQANAELLKNFKFGGSVEVSANSARHIVNFQKAPAGNMGGGVTNDRIGAGQTRIMLNMDWDLLDDVHGKITLRKNNRVYGNASETADNYTANINFDQGYFKIDKVFGSVDMTFGRQFFGEPGDLIAYFGPLYNNYGLIVTAVDGARFDWNGENMYFTGVAFEPTGNGKTLAVDANAGAQTDIRGFIVGNKGHENVDAKVYVWNGVTHGNANNFALNNDIKNSNLYIAGFKVKAKFGGAYGSAEYAQNFGEDRTSGGVPGNYVGRAFLVNGGMKADVEQIGTFNPWAEFGLGTGRANTGYGKNENFMAVASDYRPGAIYGRFDSNSNVAATRFGNNVNAALAGNGLQNRVIFGAGLKATPSALNKLTAGVAFYDFRFHRLAYPQAEVVAGQPTGAAGNKHIGSEVDVTAEWKHSENVTLTGTVGNFQPGGYILNTINYAGANTVAGVTKTASAWLAAFDVAVKF
jgi:hypothetical protein